MGALLGASSGGIGWLLVSRVMEGLGFVGIVVAAPALMREAAGLSASAWCSACGAATWRWA
jgi:hypothetical protein